MNRFPALACTALLLVTGAACGTGGGGGGDGQLTVAAAFYPIEDIVRHVGGDAVHVVTLVPPGEEAHEYEPTAQQLSALERADVVVYLGDGFQPSVEKAIDGLPGRVRRVDLLDGLTLLPAGEGGGDDPHVWLDPANMAQMTTTVLTALQAADPSHAGDFSTSSAAYVKELGTLDGEFRTGLATCTSRVLVSSHAAFAYLADAYDLTAVSIAGVSPSDEPSAKALEAIARTVSEYDVQTIFFEHNLPPDLANTVAGEVGASTAVLDTVETLSRDQLAAGADYLSVMGDNLAALRTGLGCS